MNNGEFLMDLLSVYNPKICFIKLNYFTTFQEQIL